jgi:hypothetical protein
MPKTGIASLPLHGGTAPRWLFQRMVALSQAIIAAMLHEYGNNEVLRRLSDPFWFQSLACVLGFDWHSSGCTTVTCGALKQALDPEQVGFAITGGKGNASRKTLSEIEQIGHQFNLSDATIAELQYASRMTAKIDNTALQDGHSLYHHVLFFSEDKKWVVIQQGMNEKTNYARRYHWYSEHVDSFICEPHDNILGEKQQDAVLDMTAYESQSAQQLAVDLINDHPRHLQRDWAQLQRSSSQQTLDLWSEQKQNNPVIEHLAMPHTLNWKQMKELYDFQPQNYEELLSIKGVGPNTVRALALISDLIYGEKPSWQDPVKYSFTVGGKDGIPYPVDRKAMDESTIIIQQGIQQAKIGFNEKIHALKRLRTCIPQIKQ